MGYDDYTNFTDSVLITHMLSYKVIVVMTDFFPKFPVAQGPLEGHGSIRGSGPFTIGRGSG